MKNFRQNMILENEAIDNQEYMLKNCRNIDDFIFLESEFYDEFLKVARNVVENGDISIENVSKNIKNLSLNENLNPIIIKSINKMFERVVEFEPSPVFAIHYESDENGKNNRITTNFSFYRVCDKSGNFGLDLTGIRSDNKKICFRRYNNNNVSELIEKFTDDYFLESELEY